MPTPSQTIICPLPTVWARLHQRLHDASATYGYPLPPKPLILVGWTYSNDVEKRTRWKETVAWAERHGLTALLDDIAEESMYSVAEPYHGQIGPMGGKMYLPWSYEPKPRFDAAAKSRALEVLRKNWASIAGEIASSTAPAHFTGSKSRRLVVSVINDAAPPWGSWTAFVPGETRRSFTALRKAVNQAIVPLEVDHIDFTPSMPASR